MVFVHQSVTHPELKQTNQIAEKPVDDHLRCVLKKNPKMQIRMKYKYKYKLHNDTNIRIQKCQHCNTSQEINVSEFCGFLEFQPKKMGLTETLVTFERIELEGPN